MRSGFLTQQDSEIRRSAQTAIKLMVDQLVVLVAPILSFTAEEIWQNDPSLSTLQESIFLAELKSIDDFESDLSNTEWERLLTIKELVNQQIEESRNAGEIKGSLDTAIQITVSSEDFDLLNRFSSELHFFLIVSECHLIKGSEFSISVSQSKNKKCTRCWHRNNSVGISANNPEICERCESNIDGPGEDRKFA